MKHFTKNKQKTFLHSHLNYTFVSHITGLLYEKCVSPKKIYENLETLDAVFLICVVFHDTNSLFPRRKLTKYCFWREHLKSIFGMNYLPEFIFGVNHLPET